MTTLSPESQRVSRFVHRRILALRVFQWLVYQAEAVLVLYLALFCAFMAAVWFEIRFQPWTVVFWLFNLALLAGIGVLVVKVIVPLSFRSVNPLRVSADVEQRVPGLKQRLITAVELSRAEEGFLRNFAPGLVDLFYADAGKSIRKSVKIWHLVPKRLLILMVLALVSVWFLNNLPHFTARTAVDVASLYVNTLIKPPFESNASLQVLPGDVIVLSGSDLEVKARLLGKEGAAVIRFHSEGFAPEEEAMRARGAAVEGGAQEFVYPFTGLTQPLYYQVEAGGLASAKYAIRIASPPTLETIQVTLRPPDYLDLRPEKLLENQGHIEAHAGARADIRVTYSNPMEKVTAEIQYAGSVENATSQRLRKMGEEWIGGFPVPATGTYTLTGVDEQGFEAEAVTYNLALVEDPPPVIEWTGPAGDTLYPLERDPIPTSVDFAYVASDDSALARVYLAWRFEGDEERTRELIWESDKPEREVRKNYSWDYSELTYDENIFFRLEAYDRPFLITHGTEDFNPGEDARFGSTTEKTLILEPDRKIEVVSRQEEADPNATPTPVPRGGRGGTGPGATGGTGPASLEDQRLALASEADALVEEQKDISNAISRLSGESGSAREIQAKALAGRQREVYEKQEQLAKKIDLLARAIAAQNAEPSRAEDGEAAEEAEEDGEREEVRIRTEVNPEMLRKFAHDLGKKEVFRTGNRITRRDVIGVLQDKATESLLRGDLERAKRDSFAAERKLHVIRESLKDPKRAEDLEKEAEEEIKAYDLEKLNPLAVVIDDDVESERERNRGGGVFSAGQRLVRGEEGGTATVDLDEVELSETEGINIVGSRRSEVEQEVLPNVDEERYPAKYRGIVEEYLKETGNF